MLLPATLLIGIHATFRVAGPIYRFEQHLRAVASGMHAGDCRIRRGDELHDLCDSINAAVRALEGRGSEAEAATEDERREAA